MKDRSWQPRPSLWGFKHLSEVEKKGRWTVNDSFDTRLQRIYVFETIFEYRLTLKCTGLYLPYSLYMAKSILRII